MDKIETLQAALRSVLKFLENKEWGTINYMEGSEVYGDIEAQIGIVREALNG